MKKLYTTLFLIITWFIPKIALSCALPPDILHEFLIKTDGNKSTITYSLVAWENLHSEIQKTFEKNTGLSFSQENLQKILEQEILPKSIIHLNDDAILLTFLTGSIQNTKSSDIEYEPETLITAEFDIHTNINLDNFSRFELQFDKSSFNHISPLIHPYLIADFQKNNFSESFVTNNDGTIFDEYFYKNNTILSRTSYTEEDIINTFILEFGKKQEKNNTQGEKSFAPKNNNQNNKSENINIFQPGEVLKNFFNNNNNYIFQIIGIIIAIIAGMAHGLLPGHSKSLLIGYVSSGGQTNRKNMITLLMSVTLSHMFFLVGIAIIILLLQKGTSFSAVIASNIGAILYAIFGIFFIWQSVKFFRGRHKNILQNFGKNHYNSSCACCRPQKTKNTMLVGILAGLVPCADALALFIAAISIGNIIYSSIIILAFSFGIGLTLMIIAISLNSGKNLLHKKGDSFAENFSHILTLIAGIFLIIMSGLHFV